jgi:hypothetical protein
MAIQFTVEKVTQMPENKRLRLILFLVYAQAFLLAITYIVGVWLATEIHNATISTPELVAHGVLASGFALISAVIGFLGALENQKRIAASNLIVFFITVFAGSSGFALLGNNSSSSQILATNIAMMTAIGIAMPVSGYTLTKLSGIGSDLEGELRNPLSSLMIYFALVALSCTVIAGAAVESIALYGFAVVLHVGLAALTVSLILGVVVLSVLEGTPLNKAGPQSWVPQRVAYSLLGLAAVSLAGGDGVITVTLGGVSYVVIMAELTVFVYAFLLLSIVAPLHLNLQIMGRAKPYPRDNKKGETSL